MAIDLDLGMDWGGSYASSIGRGFEDDPGRDWGAPPVSGFLGGDASGRDWSGTSPGFFSRVEGALGRFGDYMTGADGRAPGAFGSFSLIANAFGKYGPYGDFYGPGKTGFEGEGMPSPGLPTTFGSGLPLGAQIMGPNGQQFVMTENGLVPSQFPSDFSGGYRPGDPGTPPPFSAQNPLVPIDTSPFAFGGGGGGQGGSSPFTFGTQAPAVFPGSPASFIEAINSRTAAAEKQAQFYESQASLFDFKPLTKARLESFAEAKLQLSQRRSQAVGTVTDQLAKRRVLGSSFADAQIRSTDAAFEQAERDLALKEAEMRATSVLEELNIKTDLIAKANQARVEAFQSNLQSLAIDRQLSQDLGKTFATLSELNMRTRMLIAAQEAQSIRAAIYGEKSNIRTTDATIAEAQGKRDLAIGQGIGSLLGNVITAGGNNSIASGIGSFIRGLF